MEMDWIKDMVLFVEVAKTKSFVVASRALKIPHSTLSRRINALEKNLGLRLLNRTTRKVELTNEGAAYLARIEHIVEEAEEIHQELTQYTKKPHGHLRISLPPSFFENVTPIWFAEFAKLYPEIEMDIDFSTTHVDLITQKYDIAIRIGKLQNSNLMVRHLAALKTSLYATPEYIKKYGTPTSPNDLNNHQCLRLSGNPYETIWRLNKGKQNVSVKVSGRFWFNDPIMGLGLAKESMGIAAITDAYCEKEVAQGKLIKVLPDWELDPIVVSLITGSRLLPAKTRALIDFLIHKMNKNTD